INAAIGLAQLRRYDSEILTKKEQIIKWYEENLGNIKALELPKFEIKDRKSSLHLYMIRIKGVDSKKRNEIIQKLAEEGVSTNVHFQPLPLLTAYRNIGLRMENYPEAYKMHENQISLPLHNFVSEEDVKYIANILKEVIS
ncbi:MAG: DegT/DnrJ/EryC1/StrS family aminotransferase, partial [Clostridia bacterium]